MTSKNKTNSSIFFILAVRYMLLAPIFYGLGYILFAVIKDGLSPTTYTAISEHVRIIITSLIAMSVTFAFMRLEKKHHIHLPKALLVTLMLFVVATLVIGDGFGQYDRFWWWDDVLHTLSGIITALTGYLLVYFFNARYNMNINPLFVAVFAFTFALTMGVLWEIVEFSIDALFHAHMQRWNLPSDAVLIGKAYQGSGLRDTMSDLIVACIGALASSTITYLSFKHEKRKVLGVMRNTFPRLVRKK